MKLKEFLETKPLYYKKFDPYRMQKAYLSIKDKLPLPKKIIHIIGTNGKGTTGRFLAGMLKGANFKVGHYTSPHILKFNERIWLNGNDISDLKLEKLHSQLTKMLPSNFLESLSYFEYTTFLAVLAFKDMDFAILEAGLGGEFDATSVFPSDLTLVTPIGFDHQQFLGNTIQEIATTKLKAVKKKALLASQPYPQVYQVAKKLKIPFKKVETTLKNIALPPFLATNLALAYEATKELGIKVKLEDSFKYPLPGRMQKVKENIILDVGHNPLSAQAIEKSLKEKVVLIYNSYKDKEYKKVLEILKPKIKHLEILELEDERVVKKEKLIEVLKELQIPYTTFSSLEPNQPYLVYGSFKVVEEFIKRCKLDFTNS